MFPWQLLTPNLVLAQPIWSLSHDTLAHHQIKGMILDVDNTIISNDRLEVCPQVVEWIATMKQHHKIWLISNNFSNKRIKYIAESLDLPYRSRAVKPSRRAIRYAIKDMNLEPEQVAMIGDRLFTDTIAGNRLGMFTILVPPISDNKGGDPSWVAKQSHHLRDWEIWLARKWGVNLGKDTSS
ncbi:HAD superfamily (subfamily IIIA) phosphatase, TIGR01668 [Thalassoporum mexicanum PCC 7367]|uniref:YqeG family HAD IIIA-type phosphatase n=1 Tax=Thalassoporum mexicanum TaxID=3457544 RepID=UPI00029FD3FD|nr:YqeG family HAD IIIA-type phosphatase [Pseudanabaena sp. PCC 7367]AFY68969.1 HAD superfamily (subfamily IIIA) phosphatase, TIGR01668 [Pseudanabaena sp. PCC 7367]